MTSTIVMLSKPLATIRFSVNYDEKLVKIEKGLYHWETGFHGVIVNESGGYADFVKSMKAMDGMIVTSIQDNRGRVLKMLSRGREVPIQGASNVVLPPAGTAVGRTWDAQIQAGAQMVQIQYKLQGFVQQGGKRLARISGAAKPGQSIKSVEGPNFLVDTSTGKMVNGSAVYKGTSGKTSVKLTYNIAQR
jgi:hypothetical protein